MNEYYMSCMRRFHRLNQKQYVEHHESGSIVLLALIPMTEGYILKTKSPKVLGDMGRASTY